MLGEEYTLEYLPLFNEELAEAVRYIAQNLCNEGAANARNERMNDCRFAGVAALLGKLAGASSIHYITARRRRRGFIQYRKSQLPKK